ncbi:MAG: NAD-dependent epimerase/dehydratase family protein, partial [Bradymonadaceae bacterium]
KRDRLRRLRGYEAFEFVRLDLTDHAATDELFATRDIDRVVHLAARPGVRASTDDPRSSVQSNVDGFLSVLEGCRHHGSAHLVFASSSSVYGPYRGRPLSEHQGARHPVSLYAATKVSNEAMAHSYADLYDIPTTGLRFFTVYGPWGRPDMAYYLFADAIAADDPIEVHNHGEMERDFTYIDDVVDGLVRVLAEPPSPEADWSPSAPDPATSRAPYRLYNIGRGEPVELMTFISTIERAMGCEADKHFREMPPGDVESTHADVTDLAEDFDYRPETDLEEGIGRFVDWYHRYHGRSVESAAE